MSDQTNHDVMLQQTAKMQEVLEYFQGQRAANEARIAAKEAQVDAFLATAARKLTVGNEIPFDPTVIYAKSTAGADADPADNTRTVWFKPTPLIYTYVYAMGPQFRGVISLPRSYKYAPGHHENPQYGTDKCMTAIEFVVAGHNATNESINQALDDQGVDPLSAGTWSHASTDLEVPILVVPGAESAGVVWARFKNEAYTVASNVPDGTVAQEITTFGGDASFAISGFKAYQK